MNNISPTTNQTNTVNGVVVDKIMNVVTNAGENPDYAQFHFRAKNYWVDGGVNKTVIKDFYGEGKENTSRAQAFVVTNDEPTVIAGSDTAANPVEFYLHALAGCLTTSLVYHAAVNGVKVEAVESDYEGDLDVRGLLGLSEEARKGYKAVRVNMRVKSDADVDQLTEFAMYSPVFDMVSTAVPTEFTLEKF